MSIELPIVLRKGKAKSILSSSIDSALLAVEIYNKPRTTFRSEGYITMMVIAWTKLFHAFFHATIGDRYYCKDKNGRFKKINGQKYAWSLFDCVKEYGSIPKAVRSNIRFFIQLRNIIEHRHISRKEIDISIFGECQSFLYNYENLLIKLFGSDFALHESLAYSLQLSQLRSKQQLVANKSALAKDVLDIKKFIDDYRTALSDDVFNSPMYSIKLVAIPKICNASRNDLAIDFVPLNSVSPEDKETYTQITTLIKDKKIPIEGSNVGKLKPQGVCDVVNEHLGDKVISTTYHGWIMRAFNVRPVAGSNDPFNTNDKFCHYDEAHDDYVYNEDWTNFLINLFQRHPGIMDEIRAVRFSTNPTPLNIDDYTS